MKSNRQINLKGMITSGVVLVAWLVLWSPAAQAQEVAENKGTEPESKYILPEIVVTATKIDQPLNEVPLSTDVITREEIESSNALDAGDILRTSTGFNVRSYNPGGLATASLRGSQSAQVLIVLDGMPVFDPFTGLTDLSQISLAGIERIEIVRGPTSHLYGANALGGVVNLITRHPEERTSANLSVGSFNAQKYYLQTANGTGNMGYFLSGSVNKSDGWRGNDDFLRQSIFAKLAGQLGSIHVQLLTGYYTSDIGLPGPKPAGPTKYGSHAVTSLYDRQNTANLYGLLVLESDVGNHTNLTLKIRPARDITNFQTTYDDWVTGDTIVNDNEYVAKSVILNSQLETKLGRHRLLIGWDGIRRQADVIQKFSDQVSGVVEVVEWNPATRTSGIWLEYIWHGSNFIVVPGLRLDSHSEYGSYTSPNIGVVFDWRAYTFRASAGRAFRAPGFNDLFWPNAGNRDLKSETGVAYEIGLERRLSRYAKGNITLFRRDVRNMIAWAPTGAGGFWQPSNINRYAVNGFETEFDVRLERFYATISYSFLDAVQTNREVVYSDWLTGETRLEDKKRPAAFIPHHAVSMILNVNLAEVDIQVRGEYRGSVRNDYADYSQSPTVTMTEKILPARAVLDLRLSRSFNKFVPYIELKNILDTRYSEQFGNTIADGAYPMPGRTVVGGVRLDL